MADDDEGAGALYENGHWVWDDLSNALMFVSDLPPELVDTTQLTTKAPTGAIEFRDDVDLIEQLRYRRRYQRKPKPSGQADIVTVQDVKDIAIYTAPISILSPMLINMLHLPTTERFIKALILYIQYYLQVADEMASRILELETKVRTPFCDALETEFRTNLNDLRLLVAKEYCTMLTGGGDTRKYHHMGPAKKRRSLSDKDARFFETLLRMCVQIVWLALDRKAFNQIELEVNRLFKSDIFNSVEHKLKTNYIAKMSKEERDVLLGSCVRHGRKLNTRSPLMNEVFCHRDIDFRLMGIGVIKVTKTTSRIQYMYHAVAGPEEDIVKMGISLGILGMPRCKFDTMLRPIPAAADTGKSKTLSSGTGSGYSAKSGSGVKSKLSAFFDKVYPDIVLPQKHAHDAYFPPSFPDESEAPRPCSETQRRRWLNRLTRLLQPKSAKGASHRQQVQTPVANPTIPTS